jgi:hypothetical protein
MTDPGGTAARQENGNAADGAAAPELPNGSAAAPAATDLAWRQSDGSPAQRLQAEAREVFRQSLAAEMPLSGLKLGEMFDRSERWGRDRIQEVKQEMAIESTQVNPPLPSPSAGMPEVAPPRLPENGSDETAAGASSPVFDEHPDERAADGAAAPELPNGSAAAPAATDLVERQPDGSRAADLVATEPWPEPPAAVPIVPGGNMTTPELPGGSEPAATTPRSGAVKWPRRWPLLLLAFPAGVATWSGWVGLGSFTGFGVVHPLPGIWPSATINSAITLPIGVEAYAAYAMSAWLTSAPISDGARKFAKVSAIAALLLGMLGQVAYHLLDVAHNKVVADFAQKHGQSLTEAAKHVPASAPWWITTLVACLPVLVLGFGAALAHLLHHDQTE